MIGLLQRVSEAHVDVDGKTIGAMMKVSLINDGPVTLWLEVHPRPGRPAEVPSKS